MNQSNSKNAVEKKYTEKEQALIDGVELARDCQMPIPPRDYAKYLELTERNYEYSKGYNQAIKDFAEKFVKTCEIHDMAYDKHTNKPIYAHEAGQWHDLLNEIIDELTI